MEQDQLNSIIEAALLAAAQPLSLTQLSALFGEEEKPAPGAIEKALEQLAEACVGRGVELREVASGYRYQVRQEVHPWVARLWTERQTRYSRALLETLALIAYRQPITRGEIEQIRGVAVSSNIIRTLEERDWIRVVGYRDVPGKPALLGTSRVFLDYFNLKSLDQLPPLAEIRDLEDLEPELDLNGTAPMAPAADEPESAEPDDLVPDQEAAEASAAEELETEDGADAAVDLSAGTEISHPDHTDETSLERAP